MPSFNKPVKLLLVSPYRIRFEYVYTTKELDYSTYLGYAGLQLKKESTVTQAGEKKVKVTIDRMETLNPLQQSILTSWLNEKP